MSINQEKWLMSKDYLKSWEKNDVKLSIGNEKYMSIISTKINPVNNEASNKSRAPTTSTIGIQLANKMSDKGWSIIDIAIITHDLGE